MTTSDLTSLVKGQKIGTVRIRTRVSSAHSEGDFSSLPPEPQQGNVEYKLKLVNPTDQRLEHLVTQMKWRLREGQGEAIYQIGVEDNGLMTGLSGEDMDSSLDTLREMARRLEATVQVLRDRVVVTEDGPRMVAECLVRKVPEDQQCIDLRVCVLGSADVGKSTLLGVLTQGCLDNGRGSSRLNMFRHLHEVQTGRTSSISHEVLGFDSNGHPVYHDIAASTEIAESATKLITFIDLAGHEKYLRTTISGLTGYAPHYAMLVISASAGVVTMTQEHLAIAVALEVPFFVMLTKVDVTPKVKLQETIDSLEKVLKAVGTNKVPLIVHSEDDSITAANTALKEKSVVPIFCVSSVTGIGLDKVQQFLHLLPPGAGPQEQERLEQEHPEFQIDEIFDVPGVGLVLSGLVTKGIITEGISLSLGPFEDGSFRPVIVSSIKRSKAACRLVRASQSAALAICDISTSVVRRGMVLLDPRAGTPEPCVRFQAQVSLMFHPTEIVQGFRTTVHVGNIRQTAVIEAIEPIHRIKTNDAALVSFKFIRNPEYLTLGSRLLFRDGRTKGIGNVTKIDKYDFCNTNGTTINAVPLTGSQHSPIKR
jgi:GTPase